MYEARIIADHVSRDGDRLTTFEISFPRIVLAELNKHRALSNSVASSRAIPVEKMIRAALDDPFVPDRFPVNGKGMQGHGWLEGEADIRARAEWLVRRDLAVEGARNMVEIGVHKQIANRLLEPWLWSTAIVTGTEWANFFALRCHEAAQPEMQRIACMMRNAYDAEEPVPIKDGGWHLPYTSLLERENLPLDTLRMLSAARCARVSYLHHDGKRDLARDIERAEGLIEERHMVPFEHVAFAGGDPLLWGNFEGWSQMRKMMLGECRMSYPSRSEYDIA